MSIPPESIEVGKCYLCRGTTQMGGNALRVRRVVRLYSIGRVLYEYRRGPVDPNHPWPRRNSTSLIIFAAAAEREIPCDWTPETDAAE